MATFFSLSRQQDLNTSLEILSFYGLTLKPRGKKYQKRHSLSVLESFSMSQEKIDIEEFINRYTTDSVGWVD